MPNSTMKKSGKLIQQSVLSQVSDENGLMEKAIKLQSKAAEFGFDWPTTEPVFEKLQEEIEELKEELALSKLETGITQHTSNKRLEDELGDVLFCCMNLARLLKVNPLNALKSTNDKFERRFSFIESFVAQEGKLLEELSLEELDLIWDKAKENGL